MSRRVSLALFLGSCVCTLDVTFTRADIISRFSTNDEGWQVVSFTNLTTDDLSVMPNGLVELTLPPPFFAPLEESLPPPAHAASVPLSGMTAAVARAPFMKLRRSTSFFSVVMVPAFRFGVLEEQSGSVSGCSWVSLPLR